MFCVLKPWANWETLLRKRYMFPTNVSLFAHFAKKLLRKQNLLLRKQKRFPTNSGKIFVAETMFPSLPTCFQMIPTRETLFCRLGMLKPCFKTIVQT